MCGCWTAHSFGHWIPTKGSPYPLLHTARPQGGPIPASQARPVLLALSSGPDTVCSPRSRGLKATHSASFDNCTVAIQSCVRRLDSYDGFVLLCLACQTFHVCTLRAGPTGILARGTEPLVPPWPSTSGPPGAWTRRPCAAAVCRWWRWKAGSDVCCTPFHGTPCAVCGGIRPYLTFVGSVSIRRDSWRCQPWTQQVSSICHQKQISSSPMGHSDFEGARLVILMELSYVLFELL